MTLNKVLLSLTFLLLGALAALSHAQPVRDGHLYDQGRSMEAISPRAPKALNKMNAIIGQWDVDVTIHTSDSTSHSASGTADISYMNRGHAYMTRIFIPGYDQAGYEANIMQFLNYNPATQSWVLGEANSYTESISMYDGDFNRKKLVLTTVVRELGGPALTWYQVDYQLDGKDQFVYAVQTSTDGDSWAPKSKHVFTRRPHDPAFMKPATDIGSPSPNRPPETAQFDFLLGEWSSTHKILFNGQWIQFPANATAVHALNGHAILEYNWYDVDPNVPDASTTIVRLFNRSMRRWESLYLDNRGHSQLFFGGQQEGDEIVLHNFESNTTAPAIPKYVFHSVKPNTYAWYAEVSTDRGKSYNKTWEIEFVRK